MKKILFIISFFIFGLSAIFAQSQAPDKINLYFFYGDGCTHCAKEEIFLQNVFGCEKMYYFTEEIFRPVVKVYTLVLLSLFYPKWSNQEKRFNVRVLEKKTQLRDFWYDFCYFFHCKLWLARPWSEVLPLESA